MTTRLSLYNGALLAIGERELASLTENREPRRVLDTVWNEGAVDYCLGLGQWKFAKRTTQATPDTGVEPSFGYRKAYPLPSDFLRTAGVWSDEYGSMPLTQYRQEANYIFSDIEPIYLSYISNDAAYGGDLSRWPTDFVQTVQTYLAHRIVWRLTQNQDKTDKLEKAFRKLEKEAKSSDAMEDPTKFPPQGSWVSSRTGTRAGRRDRGNRGSLIG
jgi:hypothetical protein